MARRKYTPEQIIGILPRSWPPRRRWPIAQSKHLRANWPQESLYFFQSPSMPIAMRMCCNWSTQRSFKPPSSARRIGALF